MTLTNDLKEQNKLVLESKEYVSNLCKDIKELNNQLKIKEATHNASVETLKNYRKETPRIAWRKRRKLTPSNRRAYILPPKNNDPIIYVRNCAVHAYVLIHPPLVESLP